MFGHVKGDFDTAASASSAETAIAREAATGIRPPREFDRHDGSVRVTDGRVERRLLYTAANDREVCELTLAHAGCGPYEPVVLFGTTGWYRVRHRSVAAGG